MTPVLACLPGPPHLSQTAFQAGSNGAEGVDFHVGFEWEGDGDDVGVREGVDILATDTVVGAFAERKIGFYKANLGMSNVMVRQGLMNPLWTAYQEGEA